MTAAPAVSAARRQLALDGLGIILSGLGFGFVYGLAARSDAGFSPIDVAATRRELAAHRLPGITRPASN